MRSTRRTTRDTVWCTFRTILVYRQTRFTIRHHMRTVWCWWVAQTWEKCHLKLSINHTKLQSKWQGRRTVTILSSSNTQLEASSHQRAFIHLHIKTWTLRCQCNNHNQLSRSKRNRHNWPLNHNNSRHCSLTLRHSHQWRFNIARVSSQRNQWWWQFNRRIPIIST